MQADVARRAGWSNRPLELSPQLLYLLLCSRQNASHLYNAQQHLCQKAAGQQPVSGALALVLSKRGVRLRVLAAVHNRNQVGALCPCIYP